MSLSKGLRQMVDAGRKGLNKGFSIGLPKLESLTGGGINPCYITIAGASGSGKTTLALMSYVYRPLKDNVNCVIIAFSLEISKELYLAKILCMYLFEQYGIEVGVQDVTGQRGVTLSDEEYELVDQGLNWLDSLEDRLIIKDGALNASKYYAIMKQELSKLGEFIKHDDSSEIYIPNDCDKVVISILDHCSLIKASNGRTKKEEIDLLSSYDVRLRNKCNLLIVRLMQLNRANSNMDRKKASLYIDMADLKDTGAVSEDSDIVLGIIDPYKEKLASYKGYNIQNGLRKNAKSIMVMKNRYGESNIEIVNSFFGKVGLFKELPLPDKITDYTYYTTLSNFREINSIEPSNKAPTYIEESSNKAPIYLEESSGIQISFN